MDKFYNYFYKYSNKKKIVARLIYPYNIINIGWLMPILMFIIFLSIQALFGSNIIVILLAFLSFIIGLYALKKGGVYEGGSLFCFMYVANSIIWGVLFKTLLGEPLELYLFSPIKSFFIVFITFLSCVVAYTLVRKISVGNPMFSKIYNKHILKYIAIISYIIGVSAWGLNRLFIKDIRYSNQGGFGGFALIKNVFFLSIISFTALSIMKSKRRRSVDPWVVLCLITALFMGIIDNNKIVLASAIFIFGLTIISFRGTFTKNEILFGILAIIFFIFIFGPIIQGLRLANFRSENLLNRIAIIISDYKQFINMEFITSFFHNLDSITNMGPFDYFSSDIFIIDRLVTIQRVDAVVSNKPIGGDLLIRAFEKIPPGFLYPAKPSIATADVIAWSLGLRSGSSVAYPVIPLSGYVYIALGWFGVIFIPILLFFIIFLIFKKIGWNLVWNPIGIWILANPIALGAEWGFEKWILYIFRELPIRIIIGMTIYFISVKLYFFIITLKN